MTVATMPLPASRSSSLQEAATTAISWSPSMTRPFSSTRTTRSASPSSAMPRSARARAPSRPAPSGAVEPTSRLMLKPSGSTPSVMTSAPSSQSAIGRGLVAGAVGAIDDDAQALEAHVARQRPLGGFDVAVDARRRCAWRGRDRPMPRARRLRSASISASISAPPRPTA